MADYHLINTPATGVIRASDGKWIHQDPDVPNPEWTEYQEWLAAGNVPDGPVMGATGATGTTGTTGTTGATLAAPQRSEGGGTAGAHAAAPSGAAGGAKGPRTHG